MTDTKNVLKDIQRLLRLVSAYTGAIDGIFGWNSYSAVLLLSKSKGAAHKNVARQIQKILADNRLYFGAIDGLFGKGSISALNHLIPAPIVTEQMLKKIYKNCASDFAKAINDNASAYHIKTKADLCAFIANMIHESAGFNSLRENVNYSAKRLMQVFPNRFKTLDYAQSVVSGGVVSICDVIYGGRMGNNTSGDGYKYRGGGLTHLTGVDNYRLCSIGINVPELFTNPEIIVHPEIAVKSAFWFWRNSACSRAANNGDFEAACRIINGGTNGLSERKALNAKAWNTIF